MATKGTKFKEKNKLYIDYIENSVPWLPWLPRAARRGSSGGLIERMVCSCCRLKDNVQLPAGSIPAPRNLYERDDVND